MQQVVVYKQDGKYAGWPANHGHWQWGNEFLVGFIRGKYSALGGMHNIVGALEKVQARSHDGGRSWQVEEPNVEFSCSKEPMFPPANFSLHSSIIRVCGRYDHGGDDCHVLGGFYESKDRGKSWFGAYRFNGLEHLFSDPRHNTSRTCTPGMDLVLLSFAEQRHWGSDSILIAHHDGHAFYPRAVVVSDDARAVMPAAAWTSQSGALVVVARRRGTRRPGGWIDAFLSRDNGLTWSLPFHVADTGEDNGNPPALIEADGVLYCAYGNRTSRGIYVTRSEDEGKTWYHHATLRANGLSDIGYPRLFKRNDGRLVCVYYWADSADEQQHICATIFDPR